jgi:tyrosine-protein kinase Etk/Wzc
MEDRMKELQQQVANYKRKEAGKGETAKRTANANSIVELESSWSRLNRELQEEREAYPRLEDRAFRANLNAESASRAPAMRIIDPAFVPKHPISMSRYKVLMLGLGASFFVALGMMLLFALLDDRIYTQHDVDLLGVGKVLAVLPMPSKEELKRLRLAAKQKALASRRDDSPQDLINNRIIQPIEKDPPGPSADR